MNYYAVSAASIDITPKVSLPTLASRDHLASPAPASLEINAVAFSDGTERTVFLSIDALSAGNLIRSELVRHADGRVPDEGILLAATHTHFAPSIDSAIPSFLPNSEYLEFVLASAKKVLDQVLDAPPVQVEIRYAEGKAFHAVHRRRSRLTPRRGLPPWKRTIEMRPNFLGKWDETIRVMVAHDDGGKPNALIWGYSCHPVGYPDSQTISGDFPMIVRRTLRNKYGTLPVVFLQGFSGDVRPRALRPRMTPRNILRPPAFAPFTPAKWHEWSATLASEVVKTAESRSTLIEGAIRIRRWKVPISDFGPGSGKEIDFQAIRFGEVLSIFGISAEVLNAYTAIVRDICGTEVFIPVGCLDSIAGYLPTSEAVREGGYEPDRSMAVYGLSGHFRPDVSEVVAKEIRENRIRI